MSAPIQTFHYRLILIVSSPYENLLSIDADIKGCSATLEMIDDEKLGSSATEESSIVMFDFPCPFRKSNEF